MKKIKQKRSIVITKRQLRHLVEMFVLEAPLATSDSGTPSISIPKDRSARKAFKRKSDQIKPRRLKTRMYPSYEDEYKRWDKNPSETKSYHKKIHDYISSKYVKLFLSASKIKRISRQLSKLPVDVHFVLLPHMSDPEGGQITNLNQRIAIRDRSLPDSRDHQQMSAERGTFLSNREEKDENDPDFDYEKHHMKNPGFSDDDPLSRHVIVDSNDSRMKNYNDFIKRHIKEKTGAVVKKDDLVFVTFVLFREMRVVLRMNDFEKAKAYIDSTINKKFFFQDSLYMLMHSLFDSGPMTRLNQILIGEMFIRLRKYDDFFAFPLKGVKNKDTGEFDVHAFNDQQTLSYSLDEFKILQDFLALSNVEMYEHSPGCYKAKKKTKDDPAISHTGDGAASWKDRVILAFRQHRSRLKLPFDEEELKLLLASTTGICVRGSKRAVVGQKKVVPSKELKQDQIGSIIRKNKQTSDEVRKFFRAKTIQKGTINTAFDFVAEMMNVAFLTQSFPLNVKRIKASNMLSQEDKDFMLNKVVPYFKEVHDYILRSTQELKGKFIYGSHSDLRS